MNFEYISFNLYILHILFKSMFYQFIILNMCLLYVNMCGWTCVGKNVCVLMYASLCDLCLLHYFLYCYVSKQHLWLNMELIKRLEDPRSSTSPPIDEATGIQCQAWQFTWEMITWTLIFILIYKIVLLPISLLFLIV